MIKINAACQSNTFLSAPAAILCLTNLKIWGNKPKSLHLLLTVSRNFYLIPFTSNWYIWSHLQAVPLVSLLSTSYHSYPLFSTWLSSCSRPVPEAPPPTPHGALAAAGQAADPAGTVWAVARHSSARSGSQGSGGPSCPEKVAPAQKRGKVEVKEGVGWWRKMMPLLPGRTPCPSRREGPDIEGWSRWRLAAPWIYLLMLCCRYKLQINLFCLHFSLETVRSLFKIIQMLIVMLPQAWE